MSDTIISELEKNGVNTASGLEYCAGEADLYYEVLDDFATEAKTKTVSIEESKMAGNWKDYEVYVHSLKSTARMIGADRLADMALELETAAKAGDSAAIEAKHEETMNMYTSLVELIRKLRNVL